MHHESHPHAGVAYLDELPQARPHIHETRTFPKGFLWGAALSSHQAEGGTDNDWSEWEKDPGHIIDGTKSDVACDHFNRYAQDFALAKSLGQNAHRLSIEWSRIEPVEGQWNMDAVVHYRKVLEELRAVGLEAMVTCWHFTLPRWFAEKGGWEAPDAVRSFKRYCEFLAREYGDLVGQWVTINEPMVYLLQAYGSGAWPPGKRDPIANIHVFSKMCLAHQAAYKAMHRALDSKFRLATGEAKPVMIGVAQNVMTYEPYRKYSMVDNLFVWFADKMYNRQFFIWTRGAHDFIGINYYFHYRIKYLPTKASQFFYEVHTENREVSDLGWELNPEGIFEAIASMSRYKKPIYITENGVANADDGKRPRLLVASLKEVYHAIQAGIDVRGYFHWSLLDNFEWERGFSGRFGLVAVDYATQKRTPRRSAYVYEEICRENGISHRLLKFMGHGVRW